MLDLLYNRVFSKFVFIYVTEIQPQAILVISWIAKAEFKSSEQ